MKHNICGWQIDSHLAVQVCTRSSSVCILPSKILLVHCLLMDNEYALSSVTVIFTEQSSSSSLRVKAKASSAPWVTSSRTGVWQIVSGKSRGFTEPVYLCKLQSLSTLLRARHHPHLGVKQLTMSVGCLMIFALPHGFGPRRTCCVSWLEFFFSEVYIYIYMLYLQ